MMSPRTSSQLRRDVVVLVSERVARAAAHGRRPEGDLATAALVVARLHGDALEVAGPGRIGIEVEQDVEDPPYGSGDLHRLGRLVSHPGILAQGRSTGPPGAAAQPREAGELRRTTA